MFSTVPILHRLSLLSIALLLTAQGCTFLLPPPTGKGMESFPLPGVPITIRYQPADRSTLPLIKESIMQALPRVPRWGRPIHPVTVIVCPDHDSLERAVQRHGYRWLKAWATEETIYLQSPRSWLVLSRKRFLALVTHELTHVVHYQTAGLRASRSTKNDPLWFREGLASYTAGQGSRRYSRKTLRQKLRTHPSFNPLSPTKKEIQKNQQLVYSAAHHLVTFLIEKFGEGKIRKLLRHIAEGNSFDQAFEKTYGTSSRKMEQRWELWLTTCSPSRKSSSKENSRKSLQPDNSV